MTVAQRAHGGALKRIWLRLPEDTWLAEGELQARILEITGAYAGDFAHASALCGTLVSARALEVRRVEGGRDVEYRRADEWTDWPDAGPGSEAFNAGLRRQTEADLRELDRQRQRELEDSPFAAQYRLLLEMVNRRIDGRLREMEQTLVERVRARLRDDNETGEQD